MANQHTKHPIPFEQRFWAKVDKNGPNGCWVWTGGKISTSYGAFWRTGKLILAHRFAYELLVASIPEGLILDHLCRNPSCVNPAHLEAVSNRINILRGHGWPAEQARKTHCAHGHPFDLFNTYFHPDGSRTCRMCRPHQRKPKALKGEP